MPSRSTAFLAIQKEKTDRRIPLLPAGSSGVVVRRVPEPGTGSSEAVRLARLRRRRGEHRVGGRECSHKQLSKERDQGGERGLGRDVHRCDSFWTC